MGAKGWLNTITIVTGLSGSGKTTAIRAFEDAGAFCVDNLPVTMVPSLIDFFAGLEGQTPFEDARRLVLGIDCRNRRLVREYAAMKRELASRQVEVEIVFIDARDDVLVRRFSETRRPHPLAVGGDVLAALRQERALIAPLLDDAARVLDSSQLNIHQLRESIASLAVSWSADRRRPQVTVLSFGFKHGVPLEADLVYDVRFLANPYFVPELTRLTGRDEAVRRFVADSEEGRQFLDLTADFLRYSLPKYEREGKAYLTVAIGCTGGRHRSVSLAIALAERMRADMGEYLYDVRHRDIAP